MDTRKIRDLAILLPGEDPEDLDPMDYIPRDRSTVAGHLIDSAVWTRTKLTGCTITRSWFINADLSTIDYTESTMDRCVLRGCTLTGARLSNCTLKNVIFENCRLDYATLTNVRVTGPVALLGCSLSETIFDKCKLSTTALDGCKLHSTAFNACDLRGTDLRGNDLSNVAEVTESLRGAVLSPEQLPGLTEAITRELELSIRPGSR